MKDFFLPTLTVELTNRCTLSCPMCTVHEKDYIEMSSMKMELFEGLVDSFIRTGMRVGELRLFWLGEPMLADCFEMALERLALAEASGAKLAGRIGLDTNAIFIDGKKEDAIFNLAKVVPVHIMCSLDAIRKETYDRIRVGGDFERACFNVERLLRRRGRNSLRYPRVMVQLIVQEANRDEVEMFVDRWEEIYTKNGLSFDVFFNASFAHDDGVNLRPLTVQRDGTGLEQSKANELYLEVAGSLVGRRKKNERPLS